MIVHQHDPDHPALRDTLHRLLKPRLRDATAGDDAAPAANPLPAMASAMQALAVKDADQQLADLLQTLAA